ncbi:hypothetical protein V475_12980 [Sphingobium baderi LL03]|nr:hypothetical protein V475_12980 [Sphingobium baderi LL03]
MVNQAASRHDQPVADVELACLPAAELPSRRRAE